MNQKRLIKIAFKTAPNVFEVKRELDINPELSGFEGKYLQLILDALDVDFQLIRPPDNAMGRKTPDGNWTGLIGMVHRGEADMTVGSVAITSQRFEDVEFSIPYTVNGAGFGLKMPPGYEFSNFAYLYPYDVFTWLLIFFSLLIMPILFFVIIRPKIPFSRIFLTTYGSIINQPLIIANEQRKWNWLFGSWFLFVAVLSLSYTACLLSFLSVPFERDIIRTFQQLSVAVQKGTHRVFPPTGSFIIDFLVTSDVDYLRKIGEEITRNDWHFDMTDDASKHGSYDIAYIEAPSDLVLFLASQELKGEVIISIDDVGLSPIGFALKKNFSLKKRFNTILSRAIEAGLMEKQIKDEFLKLMTNYYGGLSESNTPKQLSLSNFIGVFLLLALGITCSLLVLIFEIIFYNFSKCRKIVKFISKQ